jgi:hypothetical protein
MLEHPTGECFDMIWFGSITYIFVFTFPPSFVKTGWLGRVAVAGFVVRGGARALGLRFIGGIRCVWSG